MLRGTNLKFVNSYNLRIVLEMIRLYGPMSRIDISRSTHLTAQTVTNITKKLMEVGLIFESDRKQNGKGAPSILLKSNPDCAYSIGVDFDKDHLNCVLVDFNGVIRESISQTLNCPAPDQAIDMIVQSVRRLIKKARIKKSKLWGVGVGVPGPMILLDNSIRANIINPKFYPGWDNVPIVQILKKKLKVPVYIENNAAAAAIGERWYGIGKHIDSFFYIFFGAGIGGGMVLNGLPYPGFRGNSGEIGYLPLLNNFTGKLQLDDSAHVGMHFDLLLLYNELKTAGYKIYEPAQLEKLFLNNEPILLDWMQKGAEQLAYTVLAIEYLIDPEIIFFGGRLPECMISAYIDIINEIAPRHRISGLKQIPELKLARAGVDATALGSATLPLYNSFAPIPSLLHKKNEVAVPDLKMIYQAL